MSLRQFINGSGELHFEGVFLSPRIIKEALEKRFRLVTIVEFPHHVQYKIIRLFRLYRGPAIFPQARIDIAIRKDNSHSSLYWHFIWPEYYVFLISFIILFAVVVLDNVNGVKPSLLTDRFELCILPHGSTATYRISRGWYHVICRGNEKRNIFRDDADRDQLFGILSANLKLY